MKQFSFPKKERLLNREDFVNLNRLGKRQRTKHFTVIYRRNDLGLNRLGITASKKIGIAVKRNRVKRLIREFFRRYKHHFPQGYDIVIIPYKGADGLDFRTIQEELSNIRLDQANWS
jgi:ribonuclease P protein component